MLEFKLQKEKAKHALLYVIQALGEADMYKTLKILYFAEQKHLVRYARPIMADTYIAPPHGPVPSYTWNYLIQESGLITQNGYIVSSVEKPDLDELSESDIECLNESISENKNLSFSQLKRKSHDTAYNKASWIIDYIEIAKAAGANDDMIKFIMFHMENEKIFA